ncbi:MAG: hypothetical protein AAGF12_42515 [Myxococcota bacterium]
MRRIIIVAFFAAGCADEAAVPSTCPDDPSTCPDVQLEANLCRFADTEDATASCLAPTMPPDYYVAQAALYFDTLDLDAPEENVPTYHPEVIRWEWPPWLKLTGYTADVMISSAAALRRFDPSRVPVRDCRFFPTQPFARCYVVFEYPDGPCPIYEEFAFNDAGEMTFIEAWSDLPGFRPQPETDRWAEAPEVYRLSNLVPGLGNSTGTFDPNGARVEELGRMSQDVADFAARAKDWERAWGEELINAGSDLYVRGCGWDTTDP